MSVNGSSSVMMSEFLHNLCSDYKIHNSLTQEARDNSNIKRGLRNDDGTGVMVGCTKVGNVLGYRIVDGEREPMEGKLFYRGYELSDLVDAYVREGRFGFSEVAYLLLFGRLPTREHYEMFTALLHDMTALPENFTEDMILKNPSHDIMNKLGRSVLALYSCDPNPDDLSVENMMRQSIELVARFPVIAAYAYVVKRHYFENDSLYLHRPMPELSTAENFLHMIRPDKHFTHEEARLLDLCLVCHAEHGGGNNSTFSCRSVASTGTDTYSAIAAAVGSLKGPKHGGANQRVLRQFEEVKQNVRDWKDDDEVAAFVRRILQGEVSDHSGLVYGMGHAVYTLSDPRTVILKKSARKLAAQKHMLDELELMEAIERVTPKVFAEVTGKEKVMCANVDMYSGLIYRMLDIPTDLFTPLFAVARITGWCAHRMEEALTGGRIYRPAYKPLIRHKEYVPFDAR
ncbi:MAG: citrate/2-methylcitrate synthase [Faecousia sp.]